MIFASPARNSHVMLAVIHYKGTPFAGIAAYKMQFLHSHFILQIQSM
jgi:hypothetical protein